MLGLVIKEQIPEGWTANYQGTTYTNFFVVDMDSPTASFEYTLTAPDKNLTKQITPHTLEAAYITADGAMAMTIQDVAYPEVFQLTVNNGSGMETYAAGTEVTVKANPAPNGQVFKEWSATGITLTDAQKKSQEITISMPAGPAILTAVYENLYLITFGNTYGETSTANPCIAGTVVTVVAQDRTADHWVFEKWTSTDTEVKFANATQMTTTFSMPAKNVTVTPVYTGEGKFEVTVTNGTVVGDTTVFYKGDSVTVKYTEVVGRKFKNWKTSDVSLTDADKVKSELTFTMPEKNVAITAEYVLLHPADTNKDEKISTQEYLAYTTPVYNVVKGSVEGFYLWNGSVLTPKSTLQADTTVYNEVDTNGDKKITVLEYGAFKHPFLKLFAVKPDGSYTWDGQTLNAAE
jgi:hypothetical protein